jgi:Mce-associated membrane protein
VNATWYDVLGVEPTATTDEIRVAWRAAVADLDPTDRRFRIANQAAEVLLDPGRRAAYDAELPEEDPAPVLGPVAATEAEPARALDETPTAGRGLPDPGFLVPGWLLIGLAVLTAAALVVVGVLLTRPSDSTVANDTTAAQAAAERAVVPILSYDAHHLSESQAQATPYLTDSYRAEYDKLFTVIKQNAPRTGTVVRAKYLASGIVRTGVDRVDVLVFVNQVTYNKQHPQAPVIYKNQATVTMVKVGDNWLVDDMKTTQPGA